VETENAILEEQVNILQETEQMGDED